LPSFADNKFIFYDKVEESCFPAHLTFDTTTNQGHEYCMSYAHGVSAALKRRRKASLKMAMSLATRRGLGRFLTGQLSATRVHFANRR
jgi:hypothetical protein